MALQLTVVAVLLDVWLATTISEAALLWRLANLRLVGSFRIFSAYLIADILRSIVLLLIGHSPEQHAYWLVWSFSEPVFLVFQVLVALELFRLLYSAYPGIHAFARILIGVAIVVGIMFTFGTIQVDVGRIHWRVPSLQRLFVAKRVVSSLLGVIILITMACFPRAASARNVLLHGWLLGVLFISAAGGFFGINFGLAPERMGLAFMSVQLACFVVWAAALRPGAARVPRPSPAQVARAVKWNDDLLHVTRWLAR